METLRRSLTRTFTLTVGMTLAPVLLAGCASLGGGEPYAMLEGRIRGEVARPHVHPLQIRGVDGELKRNTPLRLEPGVHQITAMSEKPPVGNRPIREQTFELELEPCKHYFVAAEHSTRLDETWEMVVTEVVDAPRCRRDG